MQDSWSILDKVTLNLGLRYDTQSSSTRRQAGHVAEEPVLPARRPHLRPTQAGRSKIFANYARYYEERPARLRRPRLPGAPGPAGLAHGPWRCNRSDGRPRLPASSHTRAGPAHAHRPQPVRLATGGDQVPVDPALQSQASDELAAGGEYEILPDGRLGLNYTHRYMDAVIEDMSRDEATTYFIGNPG